MVTYLDHSARTHVHSISVMYQRPCVAAQLLDCMAEQCNAFVQDTFTCTDFNRYRSSRGHCLLFSKVFTYKAATEFNYMQLPSSTIGSAIRLIYRRCSQTSTDLPTDIQAYIRFQSWTIDVDNSTTKSDKTDQRC